jgi:hypothetical protein
VLVDHLPLFFKVSHERQHSPYAHRIIFYISCPKLTRTPTLKGRPFHKVLRSKSNRKRKTARLFCKKLGTPRHRGYDTTSRRRHPITYFFVCVLSNFRRASTSVLGISLNETPWGSLVSFWILVPRTLFLDSYCQPIPFWCRCTITNMICSCRITAINSDFQCHALVK